MSTTGLENMSRAKLAEIGREYMLIGQMNSRTGYAALAMNHGQEAYKETAIDNWMAASPVYSKRMQKAMRLTAGSDVAAILKGMQLECGLSHQYFDARFEINSDDEGFFWLNSCGPLLETEPRGEAAVKVMCHDIEDPTFDATAAAGNPQARVRPVHRPPRKSSNQTPVCRWRVYIDHDAEPLPTPEVAVPVFDTKLANLVLDRSESKEQGGLDFYDGPLFEKLVLERFSQSALVTICKELGIQIHLLIHALGQAIANRFGEIAVADIAEFQMTGTCWVASERLAACLGYNDGGGIDAVIAVLQVHPAFQPREYAAIDVYKTGPNSARVTVHDCPAARDEAVFSWFRLLSVGRHEGLKAMVQGVDARAGLELVSNKPDNSLICFDVVIDESPRSSEERPSDLPVAVQIAKGTQLYSTKLSNHIDLLNITA